MPISYAPCYVSHERLMPMSESLGGTQPRKAPGQAIFEVLDASSEQAAVSASCLLRGALAPSDHFRVDEVLAPQARS
jgi:hypothetical protein